MSTNPYVQVALTYVRRPFATWLSRLVCVFFCLVMLPQFFLFAHIGQMTKSQMFFVPQLMPFLAVFFLYAFHVKSQFADSRARLTPGFRRVHLTVASLVAIAIAVAWPALFVVLVGWHSIGFVALAVASFGAIAWISVQGSSLTGIALAGLWFVAMATPSGQNSLSPLVAGQYEGAAMGLLAVGIFVSIAAGVRLGRLTEDMPGFSSMTTWNEWERKRPMPSSQRRILPWLFDWLLDRQMEILTRHARQASNSQWSRICRWRVGMPIGWSLWCWMLFPLISLHVMIWCLWLAYPGRQASHPFGMASFMALFMPAIATVGVYTRRAPILGYEMTRPVNRRAYVRQIILAGMSSQLLLWAGMMTAIVLWGRYACPVAASAERCVAAVVGSGAFQVLCFAVAVCSVRRKWLGALAMMILFPAAQVFQMLATSAPVDAPIWPLLRPALWASAIAVIVAVAAIYGAYRRWLAADFD